MSKVISFSISDRYLDKLRSLYPALTDNLAAKQFVTDRLDGSLDDTLDDNLKTLIESSLSSSLDDTLDDVLDDKLKTIIETSLDDVLDERLDAVMGKLLTSLSERMARLEKRLDTKLDDGLDEMELLLRMQREASITSLIPTEEPFLFPTIEETVETVYTVEAVTDTVEAVTDTVESDSIDESVTGSIGPVPGDSSPIEPGKGEGMNPNQARDYLVSKGIKDTSYYYLNKWAKDGVIETPQGKNALKHLKLINKLYYPIN